MRHLLLTVTLSLLTTFQIYAQDKADELLQSCIEEHGIVGITAAYSVDGETQWMNAAGYRCQKEKLPFTANTLSRAASIAKSMTAVAVMQLVEQKKIDLNIPIQNYLPAFPEKAEGEITTRHLLAHTSGISGYQDTKEVESQTAFSDLQAAMEVFQDRPLLFEPGSSFFYTTYGYVVLGRIIEEVSGLSYADYMQQHLFDKAGMTHTSIEIAGQPYDDKSCLYHKNRRKAKLATANDLSNRIPGGGIQTNLPDLMRFGQAIVDHQLLTASSLAQMSSIQFDQKEGNPYGLGWFLYGPPPHQHLVIGHSGEQTGCAAQLMIIPKSKTVVAVMANTSGTWKEVVTLASKLIQLSEAE